MTSLGAIRPSRISSYRRISAVGALPMAKIRSSSKAQAFSMLATARVVPALFAASATSVSDMKQYTCPPYCSSTLLLMPDRAIWVSVTMDAP